MLSVVLDTYFGVERHVWAWGIGTAFALAAVLISVALIVETWRHNHYPPARRYLVLVLLMVPVYAVFAWLGLIQKEYSQYWDLLRGCYEAVAIWAFYEFLVVYMGGRQHMAAVLETKEPYKHLAPFCCVQGWSMHVNFYRYTRLCVIQYIPIQVAVSIVIFVTSLTGNYQDGHFAVDDVYPWTALVVNFSQIAALYGLVEFYQLLKHDLEATHPFYKFLCIKLVVFFTFWQSVFLSLLVTLDVITPTVSYTTDQESYGIDDFVICIEMFFFAIAHWLAFPPREFDHYQPPPGVAAVTRDAGAKTDIGKDWMDEQIYHLTETAGTAGKAGSLEMGNASMNAPQAGGGKAAPSWAYTRTEGPASSEVAAGGGEVQMARFDVTPTSEVDSTGHSVHVAVQPVEQNGGSAVPVGSAEAAPRAATLADVAHAESEMEVTDVS